ncbi:hypothetical protein BU15DRAFT_53492 [Melanogaster broomeanus]|nr:hypothetical protein BU15DRAFT_53492 [Melanogaster broomeanus]
MSTVDWEGNAEHVAMHWPYILVFNSQFIEVRHASKGHLVQIILGDDIRCVCDATDIQGKEGTQQIDNVESCTHVVMSVPLEIPSQAGKSRTVLARQVFEVSPTFALASNLTES